MMEEEIIKLRNEVAELSRKIMSLSDMTDGMGRDISKDMIGVWERMKKAEADIVRLDKRGTSDLIAVGQHVVNLSNIVRPIEEKVFPGARETRKHIESVVGKPNFMAMTREDLDERKGPDPSQLD